MIKFKWPFRKPTPMEQISDGLVRLAKSFLKTKVKDPEKILSFAIKELAYAISSHGKEARELKKQLDATIEKVNELSAKKEEFVTAQKAVRSAKKTVKK